MQLLTLPSAVPDGIEVWLLPLNLQAPLDDADLSILSNSERMHATSLHFHEDRVRSVATRAALRRLLAPRVMSTPQALLFATNAYGKPFLQSNTHIEFNVSHAGSFALIAMSRDRCIGVDIECVDRPIDVNSLARYVFSPLERLCARKTRQAFMLRWVAKESALKALGFGISEHLQTISIISGNNADYQIVCNDPSWPELKGWLIALPSNDYLAALTVQCQCFISR